MIESKARLVDISKDWESGKFRLTFELDSFLPNMVDAIKDVCLRLSVKRWKEKRSIDANNLFWHCIGEIAAELRADKWEIYLLMLKRYGKFTYICVKPNVVEAVKAQWREVEEIGEIEINGEKAIQLLCYFGSSTYNTKEFSVLLDGTLSEMKELGIPTPSDETIERSMIEWLKRYGKK